MQVATFDVNASTGAPSAALPAGVLFWRAFGRMGANVGTTPSSTWQFTVGARSATRDVSWGTTLDVNGDGFADVLVGAPAANSGYGYAFLYHGSATGLPATASMSLSVSDGGGFATSLASAGDINGDGYADVIVAAPGVQRVYVFVGGATGLRMTPSGTQDAPASTPPTAKFATSVAAAGLVDSALTPAVIVGAANSRAFVYGNTIFNAGATPLVTFTGSESSAYGKAISGAGDLNGDGYADVIVSAPEVGTAIGRVYAYLGSDLGLSTTSSATFGDAGLTASYNGASISGGADVNGDGFADVVVGAPGAHLGGTTSGVTAGQVFVHLGSDAGLVADAWKSLDGPDGMDGDFGRSVALVGDINRDGFADVVVAAPGALGDVGRVYVYAASATGLPATPTWTIASPAGAGGKFGSALAH